jgi:hypothetical protein
MRGNDLQLTKVWRRAVEKRGEHPKGVRGDNTVFSPWDPLSLVRSKKQAGSGLEHQGIALAFLRMTKPCAMLLV